MIETLYRAEHPAYEWIDVVAPSREELEKLAERHGLHPTSVADSLVPQHLPKLEEIGDGTFLILRSWDEACPREADTIHGLTRKIAVFWRPGVLVTIHRVPMPWFEALKREIAPGLSREKSPGEAIVLALGREVLNTFFPPLTDSDGVVTEFEELIFKRGEKRDLLEEVFRLKRRVRVVRSIARQTLDVLQKVKLTPERAPYVQDLRERTQFLHFTADELLEDVSTLLHTHLSLAAHRTNEVMRVLTLFSVFFLPLTFIVGIYGMNFERMPELKWPYGYAFAFLLMAVVSGGIYGWFRKKGWIGTDD